MGQVAIRRVLLSVSDKSGLVELARTLAKFRAELVSTGGTHQNLSEAGLTVTEIGKFTGFPEMLDGRVKTLHPKVHGGILHRRDVPSHLAAITAHGIPPIDMVVINLYPFTQTIARPGVRVEEAIEQIDIGGPALIRSAGKNHEHVAVVTDPAQYGKVIAELQRTGGYLDQSLLREFAVAAFAHTARYDAAIHAYLAESLGTGIPARLPPEDGAKNEEGYHPPVIQTTYQKVEKLRYGENPHQPAALYVDPGFQGASVVRGERLHGKELSYNNILDLDSALAIVRDFAEPAAVVIKHNNPCGAAVDNDLATAFMKAYVGDPLSAFGSVIGCNRCVDEATALAMTEPNRFIEAIVAPDFDAAAITLLTTRPTWKNSVRLVKTGDLTALADLRANTFQLRPIEGGMLRQLPDLGPDGFERRQAKTHRDINEDQTRDLVFAWAMVKHVRSNAIVIARDQALVGVGAGQMSRVDAMRIAIEKAGERSRGAVLASDAFFPFRDNVDLAAPAGIVAIIQPGGSKRDQESIDACNEHGMAMFFTEKRHFKH